MPPTPSNPGLFHDFHWLETDEPHATRRKLIMAKHPEITNLFGREWRTFPLTVLAVSVQFFIGFYVIPQVSWIWGFLLAYCVGGTINHTLQLAVHELSHNLCFETPVYNQLLSIFANLPTGIPSATTFQKYHMEHHQYQGVDKIDVDIPSDTEVNVFRNITVLKVFWVIMQPLFYALRPLFLKPKGFLRMDVLNYVVQLSFDALVIVYMGLPSFLYFFGGSLLGTGLHPAAGHFIAEHYEFVRGFETYSYYGPWNYLNFNVGYHNEHHDFPKIPWSNLPRVREVAPEFYKDLPFHTSYVKVIYDYITDPNIGPFSRVKRPAKNQ